MVTKYSSYHYVYCCNVGVPVMIFMAGLLCTPYDLYLQLLRANYLWNEQSLVDLFCMLLQLYCKILPLRWELSGAFGLEAVSRSLFV